MHIPFIRRPSIATSDPAFLRYSVIVAVLMFLVALAHVRTRPGRAWAAIRQSEPAALAAGINTTMYKLWAFALASFVTGVAGALLAGSVRHLFAYNFPTQDSITLLAESIALAGQAGLDPETARLGMTTLLAGAVNNLRDLEPADAITGPASRGDQGTIQRHLDALKHDPELQQLYQLLADRTKALAPKQKEDAA